MARQNTQAWAERIRFHQGTFANAGGNGAKRGFARKWTACWRTLGVSRYQLTAPERGFSFLADGPLDMRMDPTHGHDGGRSGQSHSRKGTRRSDLSARRRKEGAEGSQSNRPSTAHTEHTTSGRCSGAGRAQDGPSASGHEDIHGAADGGERRARGVGPAAGDGAGLLRNGGRMVVISFMSIDDRKVKAKIQGAGASRGGPRSSPSTRCSRARRKRRGMRPRAAPSCAPSKCIERRNRTPWRRCQHSFR